MINIGTMLKNLEAVTYLSGFSMDRTARKFIEDMMLKTDEGKETRHLADFQIKWIADLYARFASHAKLSDQRNCGAA